VREKGKRFRIAECHAIPKGRMELKIPDGWAASALRVRISGEGGRIGRKHKFRDVVIARPVYVRIEQQRGLIVTDISALVFGIQAAVVLPLSTE
jgi:hypothetical protein